MREQLVIEGGHRISGVAAVSGAKNAALPLIVATLLSEEQSVIRRVPDLDDIVTLSRLLESLGAHVSYDRGTFRAGMPRVARSVAPYNLVKLLRASFLILGPMLVRHGHAVVTLPGGDSIGLRPVDIHLTGLAQLGAEFSFRDGAVVAEAPGGLRPARIELSYPSVGATEHLMMTAARIEGETVLSNAAQEPEVVALGEFLSSMGATVTGAGTSEIRIQGKPQLHGGEITVLGDRIEAATYLLAALMTRGAVELHGIDERALGEFAQVLRDTGAHFKADGSVMSLSARDTVRPVSIETGPFPGFATDLQPVYMAAMTRADGECTIDETVWEGRLGHVQELLKFGADIKVSGRRARVTGGAPLRGATVDSRDLRAGAALVLMGLVAEGITVVREIHHIDRGYEDLVAKLSGLGARIRRVPAEYDREVMVGC